MILSALCEYYDRSQGKLAPKGKERRVLDFIIVIDRYGNFSRFEDCRMKENGFLVPRGAASRTSGIKANCLWDKSSYSLGLSKESFIESRSAKEEKEVLKNVDRYNAFVREVEGVSQVNSDVEELKSLLLFLNKDLESRVAAFRGDVLWDDVVQAIKRASKGTYFSFKIEGKLRIIAEMDLLYPNLAKPSDSDGPNSGICLVTGDRAKLVQTTSPNIKNAKLVAFQKDSGYDSYGKVQCANAPISENAEFKYTTALNKLLAKDSKNKYKIGGRVFIFWSARETKESTEFEEFFSSYFAGEVEDDPNAHVERVRKTLQSIQNGSRSVIMDGNKFFVGGIVKVSDGRIAVVYWQETTLGNFAANILRHFDDMEVVDASKNPRPYFGIYSMLRAVTLDGKVDKALPSLPEAIMKSVLSGGRYPRLLLTSCIARIRAEASDKDVKHPVSVARAAILKAYINRLNDNNKKIDIMLDKENTNPAYLCGRLFAVLENIQNSASGLRSIVERYLNSASTTPAYVFPTLLNLSLHHSEKLQKQGKAWGEFAKAEIINLLPPDGFPVHLDVEDQGRFFLGYYQQKASRMVDGANDGAETMD